MRKQFEPKWITDAAKSMLQGSPDSHGDEDQNDLMSMIDDGDHDVLPDDEQEPEWLVKAAESLLRGPKDSYGDEDQNDIMEAVDSHLE